MIRIILSILFLIVSIPFLVIAILSFTNPEIEGRGLAIGLTLFLLVAAFFLKPKSQRHKDHETKGDIALFTNVHHLEGLPVAEKTQCRLVLSTEEVVIEGGGINFKLLTANITAAEIKTDVEIANVVHSSAAKGIAGGLLFGPIGLVIGARAGSKEKRTMHSYLILNYISSSGDVSAMVFRDDIAPHLTKRLVSSLKQQLLSNYPRTIQI